jgi:hypothetical protein
MSRDPRIDAYIAKAQPFARPILTRLRDLVHAHCPGIAETLRWSSPAFLHKGKILSTMAAFKGHATFGFWHGELVTGTKGIGAMGSFGRLASLEDLPEEAALAPMFATAMRLIDEGVKPPQAEGRGKHARPELAMTPAFEAALDANPAARKSFDGFAPSHRREYLEWILDAKRDETRDHRIAQAVEWLAEGKKRNWKYENC